jgi:hypothetical protein
LESHQILNLNYISILISILSIRKIKEAGDKNFSLVPTSSTTILACIGDALAITVAKKRNFKISKFGEHHPHGSIGKSLTPIKDLLITGKQIPYVDASASSQKFYLQFHLKDWVVL